MPAASLPSPAGVNINSTIQWLGMLGSKDMTCYGLAKAATSPALGPLAPDAFTKTPFAKGAPAAAVWSPGGFSFSAFVSVTATGSAGQVTDKPR